MKVKDLLTMEIDIDVYDDYTDELGICFCGPMTLTDAGRAKFADALEYEIELHKDRYPRDYEYAIVCIDGRGDEDLMLLRAEQFFKSAAGYCSIADWNRWFKEGD